jgi:hypothetical protein
MTQIKNYNNFVIYNTHLNTEIKINDAIKVTSKEDQKESFWCEVSEILNDGSILCSIQNRLVTDVPIDYLDNIIVFKKNIKEFKKEANRFNMTNTEINLMTELFHKFFDRFGRSPTETEFETYININFRLSNNS